MVPPFSEAIAKEEQSVEEESIPFCAPLVFPLSVDTFDESGDQDEALTDAYLSEAREVVARGDDFLLHVLYECGFDVVKALKILKRVFLFQEN